MSNRRWIFPARHVKLKFTVFEWSLAWLVWLHAPAPQVILRYCFAVPLHRKRSIASRCHTVPCRVTLRYLELFDVVGRYIEADADRDEYESDDEEGREHGARGEDGLPGGQPLLLKRSVLGLLAPQRPAARPGHGDVSILVVTRRHHRS